MAVSIFTRILSVLILLSLNIHGQELARNFWVPGDPVHASLAIGNTLYAGGSFDRWAPPAGNLAILDPETGRPDISWPQVLGTVYGIESDGNGGCYIIGDFTHVDGLPRPKLAHINADGSLSDWAPAPNDNLYGLTILDSLLIIFGKFTQVNGIDRGGIAAISIADGSVTSWHPQIDGEIYRIAKTDSMLYLGGDFLSFDGQAKANLVEYDFRNEQVTNWSPIQTFVEWNYINHLDISGNTLYIGGKFNTFSGNSRINTAAININDKTLTPWQLPPSPDIYSYTITEDQVYAIRSYPPPRPNYYPYQIVSMDKITGALTSFSTDTLDNIIRNVVVKDGVVYAAGYFTYVGSEPRNRLAAFDATSGQLTEWNPDARFDVYDCALINDEIFVGGTFQTIGGVQRKGIAALDILTGRATDWNPELEGYGEEVSSFATHNSILYFAGKFNRASGEAREGAAAYNTNTGDITSWNPNPIGGLSTQKVNDLLIHNGKMFAGGIFHSIGGQQRPYLAELDLTTGNAFLNIPTPNLHVKVLAGYRDTLYVGGNFTRLGEHNRRYLAAVNINDGSVTPWNPSPSGEITFFFRNESTLYVAGEFYTIDGQSRNRLAAFDLETGQLADWVPQGNSNVDVVAMAKKDDILYIGGTFNQFGGQSRSNLVALDSSGLITDWAPNPNWPVLTLTADDSSLYVGGMFVAIDTKPHFGFASFGRDVPGGSVTAIPPAAHDSDDSFRLPVNFELVQNYPNPFNPTTNIEFRIPPGGRSEFGFIELAIYDISGRLVKTLVSENRVAGSYSVQWDGSNDLGQKVSSGIYIYRLQAGNFVRARKMVLLK